MNKFSENSVLSTSDNTISLSGKTLHFIGIGGISMSSLAMISVKNGALVSGSDRTHSALTERMENAGIKIAYNHAEKNLPDNCDAVIYTAAIHDDNPELSAARNKGIKCLTRAEFFGSLMLPYKARLGIAGTHGKSTTTSMVTMITLFSDIDPTVVSGAELEQIEGAYRIGGKDIFVFEACEYTDSFLSLHPTTAIVLNIELEHVDYFRDLDHIIDSFSKYISLSDIAVVCADDKSSLRAADGFGGKLITYSIQKRNHPGSDIHYYAFDITSDSSGCRYKLGRRIKEKEEVLTEIKLDLPGLHNVSDSVAAAAACIENGISVEAVTKGLRAFHGARRRFDLRGKTARGASVYDDYAHHPTEIKATLSAAKSLGQKIWCVFQPHTYSRTHGLFRELAASFGNADRVIITDIYSAGREKNESGVSSQSLANAINGAIYLPKGESFSEIAAYLSKNTDSNDIIIAMGAGDIVKLSEAIIDSNNS